MQITNRLNVTYVLLDPRRSDLIPDLRLNNRNDLVVKSAVDTRLAVQKTLLIPTGIKIITYPVFPMTSGGKTVDLHLEGTCETIDTLEVEKGLVVVGPKVLTETYDEELRVAVRNNGDKIIAIRPGDPIARISFNFRPGIQFDMLNGELVLKTQEGA